MPSLPLRVALRLGGMSGAAVSPGTLLDRVEQLARDDRLVGWCSAPYPLLARAQDGATTAFVVAPPDVEAGVLGVAQQRVQLRLAPGLRQGVLVLAVAPWRRVAIQVGVESLADRAEAKFVLHVPGEDQTDDRRSHRIDHQPVLLAPLAGLLRVGVRVGLQGVAVGGGAAGVPTLAHRLFHAGAAALDQVAHVPLGDPLLDTPREDRRGARVERLIGGEERHVALLQLALDPRAIGGHPREPVDRLHDHRVDLASSRARQQLRQAAGAGHVNLSAPVALAVAAFAQRLAPALHVPEGDANLLADRTQRLVALAELARDRKRRVLCVVGGDAAVEGDSHRDLLSCGSGSGDSASRTASSLGRTPRPASSSSWSSVASVASRLCATAA